MKTLLISGRDKQFAVTLPDEERVAWMWAIVAAFAIPEIGAFIRSVRICFFKSSKRPSSAQFIVVRTKLNFSIAVPTLENFIGIRSVEK